MPFPNVPNVPGVPALLRGPGALLSSALTLMAGDAVSVLLSLIAPQWGIFQRGVPVVTADSVVSLDLKATWLISEYPVEQGGFESYNKVAEPFKSRVRFAAGSLIERQLMLRSIEEIAETTELFDVVTPERVYTSVNITSYDYRRQADRGAGLLTVDVSCTEVRTTAVEAFSQTKQPSGADPVDAGTVQTRSPDAAAAGTGDARTRITVRPTVVQ